MNLIGNEQLGVSEEIHRLTSGSDHFHVISWTVRTAFRRWSIAAREPTMREITEKLFAIAAWFWLIPFGERWKRFPKANRRAVKFNSIDGGIVKRMEIDGASLCNPRCKTLFRWEPSAFCASVTHSTTPDHVNKRLLPIHWWRSCYLLLLLLHSGRICVAAASAEFFCTLLTFTTSKANSFAA